MKAHRHLTNGYSTQQTVRYVEVRDDGRHFGYGEPVFIPRFENADEDDGWVMALRHNRDTNLSDLVIIDSQAFTGQSIAVIHLPARVPNGFHGNRIPINQ